VSRVVGDLQMGCWCFHTNTSPALACATACLLCDVRPAHRTGQRKGCTRSAGVVLRGGTHADLAPNRVLERPKVTRQHSPAVAAQSHQLSVRLVRLCAFPVLSASAVRLYIPWGEMRSVRHFAQCTKAQVNARDTCVRPCGTDERLSDHIAPAPSWPLFALPAARRCCGTRPATSS